MAEKRPTAIRLTCLFVFLLCCAAVYYASQFHIVTNLFGDVERRKALAANRLKDVYSKSHVGEDATHRRESGANRRLGAGIHNHRHQRRADATQQPAAEPHEQLSRPQAQQAQPERVPVAAAAVSSSVPVAAAAVSSNSSSGECTRTRLPYHVVMTAASGMYQEWQSRIAYYHYKKQKALNPCSDMGGFTRLFNNANARHDRLMDEIPTLVVQQLGHGNCAECDRGFIVMNRPWGVVQFVESEHFRSRIAEDYILVIETDHMLMRPPENVATPDRPVGFGFYYMTGTDPKLKPVVQKFLADGIDVTTVDAVGPSPIIIHKPMLKRVARPWWDLSQKMQHDRDAQVIFGWVLEMWGYNRTRCAEHTLYTPHCDAPRPLTHLLLRHVSARGSGGTEHGHSSHGE